MTLFFVFAFSIFFLLLLIIKSKKTIPILFLFMFSYYIQYIFDAYLIFQFYPVLRRDIPLTQDELFHFALPAIGSLFLGAILFYKAFDFSVLIDKIKPTDATKLGHILLVTSFGIELLSKFIPVFGSVNALSSPLKYVAFCCYIFATNPLNIFLMVVIYLSLVREALGNGMFLYLTNWTTVFFFIYSLKLRFSFRTKLLVVLVAIPLIVAIQSVKKEYRAAVYRGKAEAGVELLADLAIEQQAREQKTFANSKAIVATVNRLNQSWHLSKVMNWVPNKEPFADGKELFGDIKSAFLPRLFYENKKTIGDRKKFKQYTGIPLKRASMTVGLLGDFYLNFGVVGGCVGLFIFGALMSIALNKFTTKYVLKHPINLVWIPFIFLIWASANDEFYTVINTVIKGFFIFIGVDYLQKKFLPVSEQEQFKTEVGTEDAK